MGCMSLPTQLMYNIHNLYKEKQIAYPIQITRYITLHKEYITRQHYTLHKQGSMLYSNYKITLYKEHIT